MTNPTIARLHAFAPQARLDGLAHSFGMFAEFAGTAASAVVAATR